MGGPRRLGLGQVWSSLTEERAAELPEGPGNAWVACIRVHFGPCRGRAIVFVFIGLDEVPPIADKHGEHQRNLGGVQPAQPTQ